MKCPHCNDSFFYKEAGSSAYEYSADNLPNEDITGYDLTHGFCPSCRELIVMLRDGEYVSSSMGEYLRDPTNKDILYPKYAKRPVEPEVPDEYRADYEEAAAVLSLSPKASAAISRRLLQNILRDKFKIKRSSLAREIESFLQLKDIPSYLSGAQA
jgi:hypothetical protein